MLVLHHDTTSPAAAVALLRLQPLSDAGAPVRFSGLDVLGLAVTIPPTLDLLAALEQHRDDAAALGLRMQRPTRQPPTLDCHLVGELAEERGLGAAWRLAALRGYWQQDRDLADHGQLRVIADEVGLDDAEVVARLADGRARADLRARMTAQRHRGIGGVPVLDVDGELVPADLSDADLADLAWG